jgi:hypothetical protein
MMVDGMEDSWVEWLEATPVAVLDKKLDDLLVAVKATDLVDMMVGWRDGRKASAMVASLVKLLDDSKGQL